MKKIIFCLMILAATNLFGAAPVNSAAAPALPPSSSTTPTIPQVPPKTPISRPKLIIPPGDQAINLKEAAVKGDLFFYPGVVFAKDGRWSGGDNFLNISKAMAVQVNVIKKDNLDSIPVAEKLQESVIKAFQEGGLSIASEGFNGKPPLPFFNVVILVFQTSDGYAAACQGRLFEEVELARVRLKDEVFQAITWEQTNIVFGPPESFEKQLTNALETIVKNFASRVSAHQQQRSS